MAKSKLPKWEEKENLIKLQGWASLGLTNEQIAKNIGVNPCTLYDWIKKSPEIDAALKKGKEVTDFEVENALFKRAVGMRYTEIIKEAVINPETGKAELTVTKEVDKEALPDVTAAIFWLKNRKPDIWCDRKAENAEDKKTAGIVVLPEIDKGDTYE